MTATLARTYSLPHGYSVTFHYEPNRPFGAEWSPDVPQIRKARQRQKFMEAYRRVRREFLNEVAAIIGAGVLVVDTDDQFTRETILAPTKH